MGPDAAEPDQADGFMPALDRSGGWDPAVSETHVSLVVFAGDRAYKLKKPVDLGFVDLTTRERRRENCHREVELNRRLAPDVYLGVVDLVDPDGSPVDHLVVMRRLPPERRLAALVTGDAPEAADQVRAVARAVARFHAGAGRSSAIDEAGSPAHLRELWDDNMTGVRPFVGRLLDEGQVSRVDEAAHRYLRGRAPLFERRVAEQRIVDGHGDLLADDIFCLDDGPRILDCIEFADRFRHGDVLADVTFLAMDLERLGSPALGRALLAWYRELTADTFPDSLAHYYVAYRAAVRCKVAALRHDQDEPTAADQAHLLLDLADRHLAEGTVRLVLVGGLPGTGKSTLAGALAERRGWTLLSTDEVRKEGIGGTDDAPTTTVGYQEGAYSTAARDAVYRELLRRARAALGLGESVVLDASWSARRWRDEAASEADAAAAVVVELRCQAPAEVAAGRITSRLRSGDDPSDATPEIARRMAGDADPWPSAVVIDTAGSLSTALDTALAAVGD